MATDPLTRAEQGLWTRAQVELPTGQGVTLCVLGENPEDPQELDRETVVALIASAVRDGEGQQSTGRPFASVSVPDGLRVFIGPIELTHDQVLELLAVGVRLSVLAACERAGDLT